MATMTEKEYAELGGAKCPLCGSYEHYPEGETVEDSGWTHRPNRCDGCGKRYFAQYVLCSFEEIYD